MKINDRNANRSILRFDNYLRLCIKHLEIIYILNSD